MCSSPILCIEHRSISCGHNLPGHHGQPPGEHAVIDSAEVDVWDRPPSVFRRNILTRGVRLPESIGAEARLKGLRGFRARILGGGELRMECGTSRCRARQRAAV